MDRPLHIAIVGYPGAVSSEMLRILEDSKLKIKHLSLLGISENVGKKASFRGKSVYVCEVTYDVFKTIDIALFAAGGDASLELAPLAIKSGAIVIDNSSAWRLVEYVPLVVPEVNPEALDMHRGLIANPNCSTIQLVVALKPIHDAYQIKRAIVSTYQSVSGAGASGPCELAEQSLAYVNHQTIEPKVFKHQILFNLIPQIDVFLDNGYTKEEIKLTLETKKILDSSINVTATAVRVPVFRAHAESVNLETHCSFTISDLKLRLRNAPGVVLMDNPEIDQYPMPINVKGQNEVYVGRVRRDPTVENGLNLWVVADNVRKGAALNAVQIAETLVERGLVR